MKYTYLVTFIDEDNLFLQDFSTEADALDYALYLRKFETITFISVKNGEDIEIFKFEREPEEE